MSTLRSYDGTLPVYAALYPDRVRRLVLVAAREGGDIEVNRPRFAVTPHANPY